MKLRRPWFVLPFVFFVSVAANADPEDPAMGLDSGGARTLPATEQINAIDFVPGSGSCGTNSNQSVGWGFDVLNPIAVTAMAWFDDGGNGLDRAHEVAIWDPSGALIAATNVVIPAGTGAVLDGIWRIVEIQPTELAPGTGYIVGGYNGVHTECLSYNVTQTVHSDLSFFDAKFSDYGPVLVRPELNSTAVNGFYGVGFQIGKAIPVVDIDASAEVPYELFGSSTSTIGNPEDVGLPSTDALVGRTTPLEVVFSLSDGAFLYLPTLGPSGSGADIVVGDALGAGTAGEWDLRWTQGGPGDSELVLATTPNASSAPIGSGDLLRLAAEGLIIDSLDTSLDTPGQQLDFEAVYREPSDADELVVVRVIIVETIEGVEVLGEDSSVDTLGELDASGTRVVYRSAPISLTSVGTCAGFATTGVPEMPNCSVDAQFRFSAVNDRAMVEIELDGGGDPFLGQAGMGDAFSVNAGPDCEPSGELARMEGPLPPNRDFVELVFPLGDPNTLEFAVCLIGADTSRELERDLVLRTSVEFSSIFLKASEPEEVAFSIVPQCFGDLNGDGFVNNTDALSFRQCFPCAGPGCDRACDSNADGIVNNVDVLALSRVFGTACPVP